MEFDTKAAIRMIPNIDVGFVVSLLGDVFGFNSPIYLPFNKKNEYIVKGYSIPEQYTGFETIDEEEAERLSVFGTPVLGSFTIAGGNYKVYNKRGELIPKSFGDFLFPVATIVEFRRQKAITKTPVSGGSGSVKEIFGFDDWAISIKGICLNDPSRENQRSATEQQTALIGLNEIAGSLEILGGTGRIFSDKGIDRIVFEELSFNPLQGKPNVIPFEITASSDTDILLYT